MQTRAEIIREIVRLLEDANWEEIVFILAFLRSK